MNHIQSLTVEVSSYEERKVAGNNVIFYILKVGISRGTKQWMLEKRYSDFNDLDA